MYNIRKIFTGGINADDDLPFVDRSQYLNAENVRVFNTSEGKSGRIEPIKGNLSISNELPGGDCVCIGGCQDESGDRIFYFIFNSNGNHRIFCYSLTDEKCYIVLKSEDVKGGLGFQRDVYIHSCFYVSGCLYWVNEDVSEPRRIPVDRLLKTYQPTLTIDQLPFILPIDDSIISWIRKPGALRPMAEKKKSATDTGQLTLLKLDAFQFCYRYVFFTGEVSVLSAYSRLINYNAEEDDSDGIQVSIPLSEKIEQDVKYIDLVVRYVEDNSFFIIHRWDSATDVIKIEQHNSGQVALSYLYFNNTTGEALDDVYKVSPYDSVPLKAKTAEIAKNRAYMGGIEMGYDTPKLTSLSINPVEEDISGQSVSTIKGEWWILHLSGVDTQTGFGYRLLRLTNPLELIFTPATYYYYLYSGTIPPLPSTVQSSELKFAGSDIEGIKQYLYADPSIILLSKEVIRLMVLDPVSGTFQTTVITDKQDSSYMKNVWKSGGLYDAGIVFYDRYMRKCGIKRLSDGLVETGIVMTEQASQWTVNSTNVIIIQLINNVVQIGDVFRVFSGTVTAVGSYTVKHLNVINLDTSTYYVEFYEPLTGTGTGQVDFDVIRNNSSYGAISIKDKRLHGSYTVALEWKLSNINSPSEIPDWAWYYSISITKCLSTKFFINGIGLAKYATKGDDGTLTYSTTYSSDSLLTIDLTGVSAFEMGYSFTEGDIVLITRDGVVYPVKINEAIGKYIIMRGFDIGILSPDFVTFEIYTPYKRVNNEVFYEASDLMTITNNGSSGRQFSVTAGSLYGDVSLMKRNYSGSTYLTEAMSPNDKKWLEWNTDSGRPNIEDYIGKKVLTNEGVFSDVLIQDSKVNGLSSFQPLNIFSLDYNLGELRKLALVSKVQSTGTVLLAICEDGAASLYLGEQQIMDTTGSSFIAKGSSVVGSINAFQRNFGTVNPESVCRADGIVYWFDRKRSAIVQYAGNALFNLCERKMSTPVSLLCRNYKGGLIVSAVDTENEELLFSIPSYGEPVKGYLNSYSPNKVYPYFYGDGLAKTMVYSLSQKSWSPSRSHQPESFVRIGRRLYSFSKGHLYEENKGSYCNLFGIAREASVSYSITPGSLHTFLSIAFMGSRAPDFVQFRTEGDYVQESDLVGNDFTVIGNLISASLFRDKLSPNVESSSALVRGDRMSGHTLLVTIEYDMSAGKSFYLENVSHGMITKAGTLINVGVK